ncbi:hypothetical protein DFH07DRAFT_574114 [Mycena maculata]|uniref:Uncharacterized protein n=1 Tax=Mycena maculata TaxID=230809 RepID=A0AAD7N6X0_9AGAR|nr:hypothetical protein DFH07DRAFT_574114 [Mycena maculata]
MHLLWTSYMRKTHSGAVFAAWIPEVNFLRAEDFQFEPLVSCAVATESGDQEDQGPGNMDVDDPHPPPPPRKRRTLRISIIITRVYKVPALLLSPPRSRSQPVSAATAFTAPPAPSPPRAPARAAALCTPAQRCCARATTVCTSHPPTPPSCPPLGVVELVVWDKNLRRPRPPTARRPTPHRPQRQGRV